MVRYTDRKDRAEDGVARTMTPVPMAVAMSRNILAARGRLRLSLDQLATRARVSKGALVALENGTANPNLATLVRVADALAISVSDILAESAAPDVRIVAEAGIDPLWHSPSGGYARLLLTAGHPAPVELWRWRLAPGDRYANDAHPDGFSETVTVLAGTFGLTLDGRTHLVPTGSTAAFPGDVPHAYWASGDVPCDILMTVHLAPPASTAVRPGSEPRTTNA